jgi:aromatic ring-opening dioxygenase catalytic subunit (LigB family)
MLPTLYIPHGGGPLPVLGSPCHTALVAFLSKAARRVPGKPKGILLVSAHWEVCCSWDHFTVSFTAEPRKGR